MNARNFSPQAMFGHLARERKPVFRYSDYKRGFEAWKGELKPKVLECLGLWPESVEPNAELITEWSDRGVRKRRYHLDVGPGISAPVIVAMPENATKPLPAILCWHGHSEFGKDVVMGNTEIPQAAEQIRRVNYDYGLQMAQAGFVTFAIDWMGHGERNDMFKPHHCAQGEGRDWCNLYYLHATLLGMTPLSINLQHGKLATTFISTLPEVDADRLGVMGISGGGTMTLWSALTDERLKAAEIICYSDLWERFGFCDINYCGSQIAPGLYRYADVPDLQGLLAPLPLLVDIGVYDSCFTIDGAMDCYRQVSAIYKAAKAEEHLQLNLFAGGHKWDSSKSGVFFRKYLGS